MPGSDFGDMSVRLEEAKRVLEGALPTPENMELSELKATDVRATRIRERLGITGAIDGPEEVLAASLEVLDRYQALVDGANVDPTKGATADQLEEHHAKLVELSKLLDGLEEASKPLASDYIHSWNDRTVIRNASEVRIEDDIRDALQATGVERPSLAQRKDLIERTAELGVDISFIGFPAASVGEAQQCTELVKHISDASLGIQPVLMSRALRSDLETIANIRDEAKGEVLVDLFINACPLRAKVEGWSIEKLIAQLRETAELSSGLGLEYRVAFEDSSRTSPEILRRALDDISDLRFDSIVLNDTVGVIEPSGVRAHVEFVARELKARDMPMPIAWHGHNDKGLALSNALSAISGGATVISGTFLGVGERAGNIPLEQLIFVLSDFGSDRFSLGNLGATCVEYSSALGVEVPISAPLIGEDVFSTATGTHAAGIAKARAMGKDFEDLLFSGVEASRLEREQTILLGPNSGKRTAVSVLERLGVVAEDVLVERVLSVAKAAKRCFTDEEVLELIEELEGR